MEIATYRQKTVKYSVMFLVIFFALAAPYFIYYSSYIRIILFNQQYQDGKFKKQSRCAKNCMLFNLTFFGCFYFLIFDLLSKLFAMIMIPFLIIGGRRGIKFIWGSYEKLMLNVFKLNTQDLEAFEIQKRVVIPMFEDAPITIL